MIDTKSNPKRTSNWVNKIFDNATYTVKHSWPSWMRRPEMRSPEVLTRSQDQDVDVKE